MNRLSPLVHRSFLSGYRRVSLGDVRHFVSALGRQRRMSACRAVLDGAHVVVTLNRRGLRALLGPPRPLPALGPTLAREVSAAVDAGLSLLPVHATCLRRSVTLLRELNRLGTGGALIIGVRREPEGIEAHAWVQLGDHVVNDEPDIARSYLPISAGDAERLQVSWT